MECQVETEAKHRCQLGTDETGVVAGHQEVEVLQADDSLVESEVLVNRLEVKVALQSQNDVPQVISCCHQSGCPTAIQTSEGLTG